MMKEGSPSGIRIAYLSNFSPRKLGTGEGRLVSLARAAEQRGHALTIFSHTPVHPDIARDLEGAGAAWRPLAELERRPFRAIRTLARSFDVVQLNNIAPRGKLALVSYAAWPTVVLFVDHVSGPPGSMGKQGALLRRVLDRATMLRVRGLAGVSDYVRRRAKGRFGLPDHRALTIYGGVDTHRFRPGGGSDARGGALRITTVAALIPEKGVDVLLRALEEARLEGWRLWVVGDGPQAGELKSLASDLGLGASVEFLGQRDDVDALLRSTDVLVHPAVWEEALGYTVLEGMASGCAVVASEVGGIPELIEDGREGILVPPGDPSALAEELSRLAADPGLRASLGRAARERVQGEFTVARNVAANLDWIESAFAGGGKAARAYAPGTARPGHPPRVDPP